MSASLSGGDAARSAAETPPTPSPVPEQASITEEMAALNVQDVAETVALPGSNTPTPSLPASPETPIVQGEGVLDAIAPRADDDVFVSTTPAGPPPETSAPNPVAERILRNLNAPLVSYNGLAPRADRALQVPNAKNSQGIYPPDAAIFVANLSSQRTEDQLELSCHNIFDGFGPNHIAVKTDSRDHPFGIVQFENVEDANNAFSSITNLVLDGRKIRLERLKADRAVILRRKDGIPVTEQEARGMLEPFGALECVAAEKDGSMYIRYAYYLDCRDALRNHNNRGSEYTLVMAPTLEPLLRPGPAHSPVIRGNVAHRSAVDQKSIFVGSLPETATKKDLEDLFSEFGKVIQINIIRKTFADNGVNHFAFVEFASAQEANRAAHVDRSLHGYKLRIEPKEYSLRRNYRYSASYQPAAPVQRRQYNPRPYNAGVTQTMSYNYGMPQMATPPHHGYNAGMTYYATPPSQNYMLPMGMYSPTPPHNQYGYGAQQWGSPYGMGPINEAGEEEY